MSKGGGSSRRMQTERTSTEPWEAQQPYLEEIFEAAQNWYEGEAPEYFPGSSVVGFSGETEDALTGIANRARDGSPLVDQAKNTIMATARGDYLNENPYLDRAFESAANLVMPKISGQFSGRGRSGSGLAAQAAARGLGDVAGNMAFNNYNTERGRQMAAAGALPGLAATDYADFAKLGAVGSAREKLSSAYLQDEMNRHNFGQNREADKVAKYLALVGGGYGSETTNQKPIYYNPFASGLGGALGGAQLGSYFGSPGIGAGIGGLLGLLG